MTAEMTIEEVETFIEAIAKKASRLEKLVTKKIVPMFLLKEKMEEISQLKSQCRSAIERCGYDSSIDQQVERLDRVQGQIFRKQMEMKKKS